MFLNFFFFILLSCSLFVLVFSFIGFIYLYPCLFLLIFAVGALVYGHIRKRRQDSHFTPQKSTLQTSIGNLKWNWWRKTQANFFETQAKIKPLKQDSSSTRKNHENWWIWLIHNFLKLFSEGKISIKTEEKGYWIEQRED